MTELALPNTALAISRWILPLVATLGALLTSPIVVIHFCSAGSRVFEFTQGILVCLAAGLLTARSRTRAMRLWGAVIAPFASFALTLLYFAWIHSAVSPWPAYELPPTFETPDTKQPE